MDEQICYYETKYWKVFLSEDQAYLGRSFIILKRNCENLKNLTSNEILDLHKNIIKKLENSLKKSFNAEMFNWTCLMNNEYKNKNPKPQVHWHFRPRYRNKVKLGNEIFEDTEFSHHYNRERKKIISQEILELITKEINKNL